MANWYGTSRSNYFRVKDEKAFTAFVGSLSLDHWTNKDGLHAVAPDGANDGYWPSQIWHEDEDGEDYKDIDFVDELAPHLADGEVAVLMTAGSEKLRYVTGCAVAVKNDGSYVSIDIDDIYNLAFLKWGIEPTRAMY